MTAPAQTLPRCLTVRLGGGDLTIEVAPQLFGDVASFFPLAELHRLQAPNPPDARIIEQPADRFALIVVGDPEIGGLTRGEVMLALLAWITRRLPFAASGVPLRAAAVGWNGRAILIPGAPGAGKSALAAWFVEQGFAYLADDVSVLGDDATTVAGLAAPLVFARADGHLAALDGFDSAPSLRAGERVLVAPQLTWFAPDATLPCGLIVFASHNANGPMRIVPMPSAHAARRLLLESIRPTSDQDPDYQKLLALAERVPAFAIEYKSYGDIDGILDQLVRFVVESEVTPAVAARFLSGFGERVAIATPARFEIPAPSARRFSPKLTIGMATYDDYDGVYFSLQALRLYHPEILPDVEFLVVDNHPDGPCSRPLKDLENAIPNYRYLPHLAETGTAATRDLIFHEGGGAFALCMDCHVFVVPGALRRLLDWFAVNPETGDLVQGPLLYDDLGTISTHFQPGWRGGMYGMWEHDPRGDDPDGPPFDIPMQGLGLFACRRSAWPGFNPRFRGFGGEEGYIHQKFRRAGGRTLCLPFLRWMHRFQRPMGLSYPNTWEDRVRNYLIGFDELGLPTTELEAHFVDFLGEAVARRIFEQVRRNSPRLDRPPA
jgi:hypothetical protein